MALPEYRHGPDDMLTPDDINFDGLDALWRRSEQASFDHAFRRITSTMGGPTAWPRGHRLPDHSNLDDDGALFKEIFRGGAT